MTPEQFFNTTWPTLSALVIVPIMEWIKAKWKADWPIRVSLISFLLNLGSIYGLAAAFNVPLEFMDIIAYASAGFAVSTGAYAAYKTGKKVTIGGVK